MKQIFKIIKSTILVLSLILIASCKTADPEAEYDVLCSEVFASPKEGINAANDYLSNFQDDDRARNAEVEEILDQYNKMYYIYYTAFKQDGKGEYTDEERRIIHELASSKYEGVRKTWSILYKEDWNRRYMLLMNGITEEKFDSFFKEEIGRICAKYYDNSEIECIQKDSLEPLKTFFDETGKQCKGAYRIFLRNTNWDTYTQMITRIKGRQAVVNTKREKKRLNRIREIDFEICGQIIVDTIDGKYKYKLISYYFPDHNWRDTTIGVQMFIP